MTENCLHLRHVATGRQTLFPPQVPIPAYRGRVDRYSDNSNNNSNGSHSIRAIDHAPR